MRAHGRAAIGRWGVLGVLAILAGSDGVAAQSDPPGLGTAWAVGVQRIVPGAGFQSLSVAAAPQVIPGGFGYLVFDAANAYAE